MTKRLHDPSPVLARFAFLADAERYCGTLPDAESGRYNIDGPVSP
jgi:hypothetical protein